VKSVLRSTTKDESIMHRLTIPNILAVLVLTPFLFWSAAGCADAGSGSKFQVIPVGSRDVAALNSDDTVRIMRRSGFSDEQIMELGTQVRNALLLSGAVEVKRGKIIEAIFAINDNNVFITTRLRGNFIYNIEKGTWIGLEKLMSQPKQQQGPPQQAPLGSQTYPNQPVYPNR
jgi:hypothetical protein